MPGDGDAFFYAWETFIGWIIAGLELKATSPLLPLAHASKQTRGKFLFICSSSGNGTRGD
jgi:hypothetical protein